MNTEDLNTWSYKNTLYKMLWKVMFSPISQQTIHIERIRLDEKTMLCNLLRRFSELSYFVAS